MTAKCKMTPTFRFLSMAVRSLLVVPLFVDAVMLAMVMYHLSTGGIEGMKVWIIHTHAIFGHSFDKSFNEVAIRDSYRAFSSIVMVLLLVTSLLLAADIELRKRRG